MASGTHKVPGLWALAPGSNSKEVHGQPAVSPGERNTDPSRVLWPQDCQVEAEFLRPAGALPGTTQCPWACGHSGLGLCFWPHTLGFPMTTFVMTHIVPEASKQEVAGDMGIAKHPSCASPDPGNQE